MDGAPDLATLAEDPEGYLLPNPGMERHVAPYGILVRAGTPLPEANGVSRIRLSDDEIAARVHEVRAWFAERLRPEYLWQVGPHATPPDLEARLLDLGMVPSPSQPHATVMVLEREPPATDGRWE